jgi:hypothetical protein
MTTTTPDMLLVLPDVSITAGPQWATLLNTAFTQIDSHDHSLNKGVQITPSGLNISSDLTFNQNNATNMRSLRLFPNNTFIPTINDRTCLYALNGELYYIDAAGNNVQITINGTVDVANSITALSIKDTGFFIQYFGDTSRQFRFNASAIPTGTTRVLSVPDSGANDTFVTQTASQTLTNKTLTSPVIANINTGTVTFALPTADGVSGQVIQTNGAATLSFVNAATTVGNVSPNDSNVTFLASDNHAQFCNPTAPRTYTLPSTGVVAGDQWAFYNRATSAANYITINSSGGNKIAVVPALGIARFVAVVATPTTAANWVLLERESQWVSYTPSFTGLGTPTSVGCLFKVVNDTLSVKAFYGVGTVSATLASISLPTGYPMSTTKVPVNALNSQQSAMVGEWTVDGSGAAGYTLASTGSDTGAVYFGGNVTSGNMLVPRSGNVYFTSGAIVGVQFEVPLA